MNEILFMPAGQFKLLLNLTLIMLIFLYTTLLPNFSPLTFSIPAVKIYFRLECKTVGILISWLHQKLPDQNPHCFKKE